MMIARKPKVAVVQPVTLYTLLGQMASKRQFIEQSHPYSEEYWTCQRELAELERSFEAANKLWVSHQTSPKRQ